jgi:hypothetical protein
VAAGASGDEVEAVAGAAAVSAASAATRVPAGSSGRDGSPATAPGVPGGRASGRAAGDRPQMRIYVADSRDYGSQLRCSAASAYPTNATASISPCAMISGHSLRVRSQT